MFLRSRHNVRVFYASVESASENFRVFCTETVYDVIIFKFQGGERSQANPPTPKSIDYFFNAPNTQMKILRLSRRFRPNVRVFCTSAKARANTFCYFVGRQPMTSCFFLILEGDKYSLSSPPLTGAHGEASLRAPAAFLGC